MKTHNVFMLPKVEQGFQYLRCIAFSTPRRLLLVLAILVTLVATQAVGSVRINVRGYSSMNGRSSENPEATAVHARFDLTNPRGSPFPSDRFTVSDRSQITRRRITLPKPDCATHPSDCADLDVINTLDGFNLQPRLSIPFDGPIDLATVTSKTVFLVNIGSTVGDDRPAGEIIGINQIVWDPATNTLHAESDELLNQHAVYVLIVTRGVRDSSGAPVESSEDFDRFRHEVGLGETGDPNLTLYREAVVDAVKAVKAAGIPKKDIVAASVFTTQSVTAVLEKTRNQIKAATPAPADFQLGPNGAHTVFSLDNINGIVFGGQTGDSPPRFTTIQVPISQMRIVQGALGRIAFGKFRSPNYLTPDSYIPPVATRRGTPVVQSVNEIFFNLYLPSGTPPPGGWPVAIFGHGRNGDKNFSMRVAAKIAQHGLATIAINAVGHGLGPLGSLTVSPTVGDPVTFSAGGRANDQNADHTIGATEGWTAAPSKQIIGERDGNRQTIIDLMQLVRVIEVGMDADGEGIRDVDPSRIYYFGWSMGGIQGAAFAALEPSVRAAALNSPGAGGDLELARLSPLAVGRPTVGAFLQSRVPSLLNSPGLTSLGGVGVAAPFFNENIPLRDQPSVINTVVGAMEIQEVIENTEWVRQSGNPAAYAPHLRRDPLPGVAARPVLIQFARGDRSISNPKATEILRAGDLADRATLFRTDLAFAQNPTLLQNYPHRFMIYIDAPIQVALDVALGAQEQIASFFASDGQLIIHPGPAHFFEVPIASPLPEQLFFLP